MRFKGSIVNYINTAVLLAIAVASVDAFGEPVAITTKKLGEEQISQIGDDEADSFIAVDSGPERLSVYLDSESTETARVSLETATDKIDHKTTPAGLETVSYRRINDSQLESYEFSIDRKNHELNLVSHKSAALTTPVRDRLNLSTTNQKLSDCNPEQSMASVNDVLQLAESANSKLDFAKRKIVQNCSAEEASLIENALTRMVADKSKPSFGLNCVLDFKASREAGLKLINHLKTTKEAVFKCSNQVETSAALDLVLLGTNDRKRKDSSYSLLRALLESTREFSDESLTTQIATCCTSSIRPPNCDLIDSVTPENIASKYPAMTPFFVAALRSGKSQQNVNAFDQEMNQFMLRFQGKKTNRKDLVTIGAKVVSTCKKFLEPLACPTGSEGVGIAASFVVSREEASQIPATESSSSKTNPSKAIPALGQKLKYQRNDPASVKRAMNQYQYMGPLANAVRSAANSVSAQVNNVAYAATSPNAFSQAGDRSKGFESEPVGFDSNGGRALKFNVNGTSQVVKAKIPFSGNSFKEPVIEAGASLSSMAKVSPVKKTVGSSASRTSASTSAQSGSEVSGANIAAAATATASPMNASRGLARSNSEVPRAVGGSDSSPLKKFNDELFAARDPAQFLTRSTDTLRGLKIQVVLKGTAYPRDPDYVPKRIFDYDELKRLK